MRTIRVQRKLPTTELSQALSRVALPTCFLEVAKTKQMSMEMKVVAKITQ